jgi:hypothetical protein
VPVVVVPVVLVFDVEVPVVAVFVVDVSVDVVFVLVGDMLVVVVPFFVLFAFVALALVPAAEAFFAPALVGLDDVFTGLVEDVFTGFADDVFTGLADEDVVVFSVVGFEALAVLDDTLTGFDAGPLPA